LGPIVDGAVVFCAIYAGCVGDQHFVRVSSPVVATWPNDDCFQHVSVFVFARCFGSRFGPEHSAAKDRMASFDDFSPISGFGLAGGKRGTMGDVL